MSRPAELSRPAGFATRGVFAGRSFVVVELAADGTDSLQAGSKAAAHGSQCVEAGSHWNAIEGHGEMSLSALAGQLTREVDSAVAEWRIAGQILKRTAEKMVVKPTSGVEVHGSNGSKLGAVDAGCAKPGLDFGRVGGAIQMQFAGQIAAPSGISADDQSRQLAELRLTPFEIEMHRHLAQLRRAAHAGFKPNHASIGQVKADISAGGLAAQMNAPVAGLFLPKGEIRVDQR